MGDEFDVDQPAGDELEIPGVLVALLAARSARASRARRGRACAVSRGLAQTSRDRSPRSRRRAACRRRRRARASAPCAPRSPPRWPGRGGRPRTGSRAAPCARRAQPQVDFVELAAPGRRGQRGEQALGQPRVIEPRRQRPRAVGIRRRRRESRRCTIRSRSEAAVISREPSLPIASTATRPPRDLAVVAREGGGDPLQQRVRAAPAPSAL